MPPELSFEEAAALPLAVLTAHQALEALGLRGGETLFLGGGAGGVGHLAIQLAVARGARVSPPRPSATTTSCASSGPSRSTTRASDVPARVRELLATRAPTPRSTCSAATPASRRSPSLRRAAGSSRSPAAAGAARGPPEVHYIFVRPSGYDLGEHERRWSPRAACARTSRRRSRSSAPPTRTSASRTGTCAASSSSRSTDAPARPRRRARAGRSVRRVGGRALVGPRRDAMRSVAVPRARSASTSSGAPATSASAMRVARPRVDVGAVGRARRRRRRSRSARRVIRTSRTDAPAAREQRRGQVVGAGPRQLDVLEQAPRSRSPPARPTQIFSSRSPPSLASIRTCCVAGAADVGDRACGRACRAWRTLPPEGVRGGARSERARLVQPGLDRARRDAEMRRRLGVRQAGEVEQRRPPRAAPAAASRSPRGPRRGQLAASSRRTGVRRAVDGARTVPCKAVVGGAAVAAAGGRGSALRPIPTEPRRRTIRRRRAARSSDEHRGDAPRPGAASAAASAAPTMRPAARAPASAWCAAPTSVGEARRGRRRGRGGRGIGVGRRHLGSVVPLARSRAGLPQRRRRDRRRRPPARPTRRPPHLRRPTSTSAPPALAALEPRRRPPPAARPARARTSTCAAEQARCRRAPGGRRTARPRRRRTARAPAPRPPPAARRARRRRTPIGSIATPDAPQRVAMERAAGDGRRRADDGARRPDLPDRHELGHDQQARGDERPEQREGAARASRRASGPRTDAILRAAAGRSEARAACPPGGPRNLHMESRET